MPYENEFASKTAHIDILKNPEVLEYLSQCQFLTPPSDEECEAMAAHFTAPPETAQVKMPAFVIAADGSNYESSIDDKLPSTKIGYVKVGSILIVLNQFDSLRKGKFVDPFRVAALQDQNSSLTFFIPSANIRWGEKTDVQDSFRAILDKQLYDPKTRFNPDDATTSLRSTLFHLASRRPGDMHTGHSNLLKIYRCPKCGKGPVQVKDIPEQQYCSFCGTEVYPSDCLRLWEEVNDFQSNQVAISRLMNILEHLIPVHYIRFLSSHSQRVLSEMSFFVDGPLAVFGNAAWLHRSIMIYLDKVNRELSENNHQPILIIGLQKTGQVVDHVSLIDRFLPNNRLFAIDDDYRYKYILAGREPSGNGFGFETYYGQDFIYKTPTGRTFVFAIPYPFSTKEPVGVDFIKEKVKFDRYENLAKAINLINHFESDLYRNAVVPIALAHRYTAISLKPGGQVLDLLTKKSLRRKGSQQQ
jgi:hypothetical protein